MLAGGSGGEECEGDDAEDSSSVSFRSLSLQEQDGVKTAPTEDALSTFREQWQRELESPARRIAAPAAPAAPTDPDATTDQPETDDDKARRLFLRGIESERSGALHEAVRHYRRALQLAPDIERRLHEGSPRAPANDETNESEEEEIADTALSEDEEEGEVGVEDGDLLARLQRIVARNGCICYPAVEPKGTHISRLPPELLLLLLRWVVSSELDVLSLERAGAVCRGLFVASRDAEIWRMLCVRTWGLNCGALKGSAWSSWRQMYTERPRLRLHGCYISKTSYLRHGENSFQDQFYKPWYLVQYYRYLRFFPEGTVLMLTTAEEPAACVPLLRRRAARPDNALLSGHYRLVGDKVVVVVTKATSEKRPPAAASSRFRSRRAPPPEPPADQTFHVELQVCAHRGRRNAALAWSAFRVSTRRAAGEVVSAFELPAARFPPFRFARVRSYHAEAEGPLA